VTLLLVCVALYSLGLDGALMFDSAEVLSDNRQLQFDSSEFIQWRNAALSTESGPSGRPVSMLSFALTSAAVGAISPLAFKLVNLVIHCLTAVLAWQFLRRLLLSGAGLTLSARRREWVALTAAALWLLHPLHVSSVLFAVQRMEQLSALFTLLGLLAYLHYRPAWLFRTATATELSNCALAVLLCTLLASFAKEDGVLLLPLLILLELLFFGCTYNGRRSRAAVFACGLALYLPLLLILLVAVLQPDWFTARYAEREFTMIERLLTESRVLWQYLGWIFIPDIRPLGLHHDDIVISTGLLQPLSTALALLAWSLLLLGGLVAWRRWPVFFFALGWYLIAHVLESSVLPLDLAYEHRNYLASLGPCLLVAWGIWCTVPALKRRPRAVLAGLLCLGLALQLASRASLWGDEEQLTAYHLYHHRDSQLAVYHYANTQLRLGESVSDPERAGAHLGRARQYYEELLRLDSTSVVALATLLYLDSRYFSSLASERWAGELVNLVEFRDMRSNDRAALALLLDCLARSWCDLSGEDYRAMLLTLAKRYPREPIYLDLLARYFGQVEHNYPQAIRYHQRLLQDHPDYLEARVGLVAWHGGSGNRNQVLEQLGALMAVDPGPEQVQRIKNMLRPGEG
jgi:hypothetical protein